MKKGFHIPFHLKEDDIAVLGESLLGSGLYQWVEIKWPKNLMGLNPDSYIRGIRRLVEQYQPGVSCHIPTNLDLGQTNTGMRTELLRQIKSCIDYAAEFGATILPLHPGTILTMDIPASADSAVKRMLQQAGEQKRETARTLTIEIAQELAEYAQPYGMTVALENLLLPQEIAHSAADLLDIVQRVGRDNVRALYDCGHSHRVGAAQGEYIRTLGEWICHVHLNDNDGTCDLHLQLEEGNIDYSEMFAALKEVGYHGPLVMETSYQSAHELEHSAAILDRYLT